MVGPVKSLHMIFTTPYAPDIVSQLAIQKQGRQGGSPEGFGEAA